MSANTEFHVTSFLMFANTHLHATSQCQDVMLTLIVIQCDSLCANCGFLKAGPVDHIGVCTQSLEIVHAKKIITQCLKDIHWLHIHQRIEHKILMLTNKNMRVVMARDLNTCDSY